MINKIQLPQQWFNELNTRIKTGAALACCFLCGAFFGTQLIAAASCLLCSFCLFTEWKALCQKKPLLYLLTPLYPILPMAGWIYLPLWSDAGLFLWKWSIIVIAVADSCAYIAGSYWGKNRIAPTISAKKSWEGFFTGLLLATIISIIIVRWYYPNLSITHGLLMTIPLCFFALGGDLGESAIKRYAQVKDSGTILPGHGGILDRIDALLGSMIWVYTLLLWWTPLLIGKDLQ